MKTYYRIQMVLYVEIDTKKEMDAQKAAAYFATQKFFPFAIGYKGFKVRMGGATMTTNMLERTPKVFKEAAKKHHSPAPNPNVTGHHYFNPGDEP